MTQRDVARAQYIFKSFSKIINCVASIVTAHGDFHQLSAYRFLTLLILHRAGTAIARPDMWIGRKVHLWRKQSGSLYHPLPPRWARSWLSLPIGKRQLQSSMDSNVVSEFQFQFNSTAFNVDFGTIPPSFPASQLWDKNWKISYRLGSEFSREQIRTWASRSVGYKIS